MRWTWPKPKKELQEGELFIVSFFAFLPIQIGRECRWLEKVTVEYAVECYDSWTTGTKTTIGWRKKLICNPLRFVDKG